MSDQLVDIFFDRVPMGVAVFDRDARLVRCNRTWAGFFVHYMGVTADYVTPGRTLHELIPDNEEAIAPLLAAVLAGQTIRQAAHRLSSGTAATYWDVVSPRPSRAAWSTGSSTSSPMPPTGCWPTTAWSSGSGR